MSPRSREELSKVVAKRYLKAQNRKLKTAILDEFCANTGFHRKHALRKIAALNYHAIRPGKRGRKKKFSGQCIALLSFVWETYNTICAERLHPFIPEALATLNRFQHLKRYPQTIQDELRSMSLGTMKNVIAALRAKQGKRARATTKPGSLLKHQIPVHLSWKDTEPGFGEIDLVAHCGNSADGQFIYTLQYTDIATCWTERAAVMGKSQHEVFLGLLRIQARLPFPLKGIDSDNGSEFLNGHLIRYCKKNGIAFTRSRPYRKEDNAHIEQKNWTCVRQIVGYHRYDTQQQLSVLNTLYDTTLSYYLNFFQPNMKLQEKIQIGSKRKKKCDKARTPFERLLADPTVSSAMKNSLSHLYSTLDPITLKATILSLKLSLSS